MSVRPFVTKKEKSPHPQRSMTAFLSFHVRGLLRDSMIVHSSFFVMDKAQFIIVVVVLYPH